MNADADRPSEVIVAPARPDDDIGPALVILQLMDSSFPVGSFTHSYGLEQAVREGIVRNARDVECFIASAVERQSTDADARALSAAHDASSRDDRAGIVAIDELLHATKAASEMRVASTATGRRLLREVVASHEMNEPGAALMAWYLGMVEAGGAHGTHPVSLGLVGAALGVPSAQLRAAYLFATASTMHQAAMRLLPVSHRDMQIALHRIRARVMERVTHEAPSAPPTVSPPPLEAFAPLHEISSMRHERASVRFFAS